MTDIYDFLLKKLKMTVTTSTEDSTDDFFNETSRSFKRHDLFDLF